MKNIDIKNINFINAEAYLSLYPKRGKKIHVIRYNTSIFSIKNCLIIGNNSQNILPVQPINSLPYIFEESYLYEHDRETRLDTLVSNLHKDFDELEEAFALSYLWSHNFWHWMFEALPKLLFMESYGYSGAYIVNRAPFIDEILELLGISKSRIVYNDKNFYIKNLFFSEKRDGFSLYNNLPLLELCKNAILKDITVLNGSKRCYIKRIGSRKIINEDELIFLLSKYDFLTMIPEEYSVKDQFSFMTNVDFSIMPHGANTSLSLFQKNHSYFIELFNSSYVNYTSTHIVNLLDLIYIPIVQNTVYTEKHIKHGSPITRDIVVDINVVKVILKSIFSSSFMRMA